MCLSMIESNLMSLDSRRRSCSCLVDFNTNVHLDGEDVFMKRHLCDEWYKGIENTM